MDKRWLLVIVVAVGIGAAVLAALWQQYEAASAAAVGAAAVAAALGREKRGRDAQVIEDAAEQAGDAADALAEIGASVEADIDAAADSVAMLNDDEKARRLDALGGVAPSDHEE